MLLPRCRSNPNTTANLKIALNRHWNVPEKEQWIYYDDGSGDKVYYGSVDENLSNEIALRMEQIPMKPQWEALFDLVGLGDWQERDEIADKLASNRKPRHCYRGHKLTATATDKKCVSCHRACFRQNCPRRTHGWVCSSCIDTSFALCPFCYNYDKRSAYAQLALEECPLVALQKIATDVGSNIVWKAKQRKTWGRPMAIPCDFEFAPRWLQKDLVLQEDSQVLPKGIRYKVECHSISVEEVREQVQVDQILEEGMTRKELQDSHQDILKTILASGVALGNEFAVHTSSFSVEEAAFEIRLVQKNT